MDTTSRPAQSGLLHALAVVVGYALLFTWLFAQPIVTHRYASESDLYEYYLPIFLSPITTWSSFEFSGLPAFADPGDFSFYPPHFFFARIVGSWTGFIISAFVLAASFTYAYVYRITGSKTGAAFAGMAYGMSETMVERVPHLNILHGFAWLPLILLAIEELRGARQRMWIAIGGVAVACAFLAGHPQPAVYTVYVSALYALIAGLVARADRRYYVSIVVMYFVGGLLASYKAIPIVEATLLMARQEVNFGQFASHANSPAQMLSTIFPTILHEGREAPTYVGLATLLFAFVGASLSRRNWRVLFWVCVTVVALLFGAGDATPVPQILYAVVPLYQKFRVAARHLFLAAFGAAFLAGFAIAAIQRADIPVRRIRAAAAVLAGLVVAGAAIQALAPHLFTYEVRSPLPFALPVWNSGIWIQIALAVVTIAAALAVRPGRRFVAAVAVMMAILFADDLYSLPYPVTAMGLVPISIPAEAALPSVHAQRIASDLALLQQRALAIGGTQKDEVIPAAFARLWKIPLAGGYGPMLLDRYSSVATMGTNGSVRPGVLAANDVALDLMAVRDITVQPDDIKVPATFERDGVQWSSNALGVPVGRADCGHEYARSISIALPADVTVAAVAIVTHLRCSEDIPQDTEVMRLRVAGADGSVYEQPLRAGVDTAETGLANADILKRARHKVPPNLFDDPAGGPDFQFVTRVTLPHATRGGRLEFNAPGTNGWITIERLTMIDETGASHPMSAPQMWLADPTRWREVRRFATSRITDRGADQAIAGETPYTVMENVRALPRAWIVPVVKTIDDRDALEAIRWSQLPDGTPFDPRQMALINPDQGTPGGPFPAGPAVAKVEQIADGRITVHASTASGGFLVLSETDYPGWGARIDGNPVTVRRTDVALQGVVIPPGDHTVVFELTSKTLRAGIALSLAGLLASVALIASDRRTRGKAAPPNAS